MEREQWLDETRARAMRVVRRELNFLIRFGRPLPAFEVIARLNAKDSFNRYHPGMTADQLRELI